MAACRPSAPPQLDFDRPPIIVVDIDTLRADHLGSYGYHRPTSPALDRFATEAIRFEWAFSQAPNTPPSQSSILTSLYPSSHGRIGDNDILPSEAVTLSEAFSTAGYETAAFVDGGLMAAGFGLEQGFDLYNDEAGGVAQIGPRVEQWLADREDQRRSEPFLLLVHTYDVHSPYENTPEPTRSMFLSEVVKPSQDYRENMSRYMADAWKRRHEEPPPQLSPTQLNYAISMYDSGIRHTDDWFGNFVEGLRSRGLYDPSILVVISDHGDSFQEHGSLFHDQVYSPVARVPLIVKLPFSESTGVVDATVETIDLMPTLLDATGIEPPPGLQGESLLPLLGETMRQNHVAITESPFRGRRIAVATPDVRAILTRRGNRIELYDYRRDPLEQSDIAVLRPDTVDRIRRAIERWQAQVNSYQFTASQAEDLDDETISQLKVLGYLD